jgi:hypothetical protein
MRVQRVSIYFSDGAEVIEPASPGNEFTLEVGDAHLVVIDESVSMGTKKTYTFSLGRIYGYAVE